MTKAHCTAPRHAALGIAAALATLVGVGCGDPFTNEPAKEGELGVGNFLYRCVGDSDPYCDEGGTAENFPEAIAVGGRFNLDYNQDIDGAVPRVKSRLGRDRLGSRRNALVMARAGLWSRARGGGIRRRRRSAPHPGARRHPESR